MKFKVGDICYVKDYNRNSLFLSLATINTASNTPCKCIVKEVTIPDN